MSLCQSDIDPVDTHLILRDLEDWRDLMDGCVLCSHGSCRGCGGKTVQLPFSDYEVPKQASYSLFQTSGGFFAGSLPFDPLSLHLSNGQLRTFSHCL